MILVFLSGYENMKLKEIKWRRLYMRDVIRKLGFFNLRVCGFYCYIQNSCCHTVSRICDRYNIGYGIVMVVIWFCYVSMFAGVLAIPTRNE